MSRTALVTGASSGIGQATAAALAKRGYRVIGTSRDPSRAQQMDGVEFVRLDLNDDASIEALGDTLRGVDVLVNNAGESQSGPFEDLPGYAVRRLFQTNVFGAVRLAQLALPGMRERGYGRIVMVGSMVASFPIAYRSSYVAAKAALRGFATAARYELTPFGVWLTTVEPGSIRTGISARRTNFVAENSSHGKDFAAVLSYLDSNERGGTPVGKVVETIIRAIEADRPKPLYAVGSGAPLVFALRRLIPRTTAERLIQRRYGITR
ncbi:SDR family oxidoreductase [Actinoplanes sp. NBRC 103695]|uniref:SDR family oxidoreductase n=1 Tax=Actinoplanes sp. NBRC 103695 TaxID=3032202 RepID=UPI002557C31B|nr:SDR family oxidoreductase [Actinoplanes sp. NBRC 103695]